MKLYICANGYTESQIKKALECLDLLQSQNNECSIDENPKLSYRNFEPQDTDLIVSLGGDGALLRASKVALEYDKPLIGINAGRLGYLCALSLEEINNFNEIINDCIIQNRSVLKLDLNNSIYYATNDILIGKTNFGKTVDLNVYSDDKHLLKVRGDGLLISTPTGSTAYNVSAGGPIIDYDAKVFAITPICSQNSGVRVVDDNRHIKIEVNHDDAGIYVDGQIITNIKDSVTVSKADRLLKLYVRN